MAPDHAPGPNGADGMSPSPSESDLDPLDRLRQDLKGDLTVIRGQTQLLLRRVARLEGLDRLDRAWLMERGRHIDAAIIELAIRIEQIGREEQTGSDGEGDERRELRRPR